MEDIILSLRDMGGGNTSEDMAISIVVLSALCVRNAQATTVLIVGRKWIDSEVEHV